MISCPPHVLYGVKYIDLVSLVIFQNDTAAAELQLQLQRNVPVYLAISKSGAPSIKSLHGQSSEYIQAFWQRKSDIWQALSDAIVRVACKQQILFVWEEYIQAILNDATSPVDAITVRVPLPYSATLPSCIASGHHAFQTIIVYELRQLKNAVGCRRCRLRL